MPEDEPTKWFTAVFEGEWLEVPPGIAVPAFILEESMQWAAELLADQSNPYKSGQATSHRMYLGRKLSPDKLLTRCEQGEPPWITLIETLHHFIVRRPASGASLPTPETGADALDIIRTAMVPLLGDSAARVVLKVIGDSSPPAPRKNLLGEHPVLLSVSALPITGMAHWSDRVNLFWLRGEGYIDFYKLYPHMAAPMFRPGLDWYPDRFRSAYGQRLGPARRGAGRPSVGASRVAWMPPMISASNAPISEQLSVTRGLTHPFTAGRSASGMVR